jgi:hypothetical protein
LKHRYVIEVDNGRPPADNRAPYAARVVDAIPHEATGDTPVLALAALSRVLEKWAAGGSDRWLDEGGMLRS